MKTHTSEATVRRRWLWPAIGVVALLAWTAYSWITWEQRAGHLHGLSAFFLGVLALLVANALARLCVGTWKRGVRWLFGVEAAKLCGWTLLFMVSTVALFYAVELWRGKRAWAAVAREAKVRGESLVYESLLIPPPPDEQNFAKAPLFMPFFVPDSIRPERPTSKDLAKLERFRLQAWQAGTPYAPWLNGRESDLELCLEFHTRTNREHDFRASTNRQNAQPPARAAAAMLAELESDEPMVESLRTYSSRPVCWFPVDQRLPNLMYSRPGKVLDCLMRLVQLRASAELAAQQPGRAFDDLKFLLRLAAHGRQRPQPTSSVYVAHHFALVDALQPLWEGLSSHYWSAAQVAELQHQLEALDLLSDYDDAVRADALTMATFADRLIPVANAKPAEELFEDEEDRRALNWVRIVYPVGWSLQDQAAIHQLHLEYASRLVDLPSRRILGEPQETPRELFGGSDPFFPIFMTPKLKEMCSEAAESFPFAQTVVDLATLACALERQRLATGEFPDTLEALVPQFLAKLPPDVITGARLKYRRTAGGGFVLYSVGFNRLDDEGEPSPRHRDWRGLLYPKPELDKNDWAWLHPGDAPTK